MKIVIFSVILNQHQAPLADALWEETNHSFSFVELCNISDSKGGEEDYSERPYLLRSWYSNENYQQALRYARTADCCVFSGIESIPFQVERLKLGLLSFDMSERWLKCSFLSLMSPRLLKWLFYYSKERWCKKPLYKLCCGAFVLQDHHNLGTFYNGGYKWGYFSGSINNMDGYTSRNNSIVHFIWCARYIAWKHPEIMIESARRLKTEGYEFHVDMYGDGPLRKACEKRVLDYGLSGNVNLIGSVSNSKVQEVMSQSDVVVVTSDRREGWGVVVNEAMANGCITISSNKVGSAPYLIKNGENGFLYASPSIFSNFYRVDKSAVSQLTEIMRNVIDNRKELSSIGENANRYIGDVWSPLNAAKNLLSLINDLTHGRQTSVVSGPCSRA